MLSMGGLRVLTIIQWGSSARVPQDDKLLMDLVKELHGLC